MFSIYVHKEKINTDLKIKLRAKLILSKKGHCFPA